MNRITLNNSKNIYTLILLKKIEFVFCVTSNIRIHYYYVIDFIGLYMYNVSSYIKFFFINNY